ncbi:acyl-CoA dehydrogenase [Advenella kashmirensis W13003]|uniref:Acyl-CoA dehydrogenase n=1 Tax=Advenella kashmirensis W13003 TaxID=1424334 RepID=V8QXK8_9BURK|nr:acyl-CoA dehydrogenase [Advenella kashmirensis]ETF03764.1 acyl-CoA dehydrogenase [Advenella kashmirensis W13003]
MDTISLLDTHERQLLRDSVRALLQEHASTTDAASSASQQAPENIGRRLADLGIFTLGSEPQDGYIREICAVMQELGRAACAVPLSGASLFNLSLASCSNAGSALSELSQAIQSGEARIGCSFAAWERQAQDAKVIIRNDTITVALDAIESASALTHLMVATHVNEAAGFAIVDLADSHTAIVPDQLLGTTGYSHIRITQAPFAFLNMAGSKVQDLHLLMKLFLLARAYGAAEKDFSDVIEYARVRHQFSRPIGSFQAIQHKLANCFIDLEGTRLIQEYAAAQFDFQNPNWRYFVSAALTFGNRRLKQIALEIHHTYGANGYADDHEAARHFRTIHIDTTVNGGWHKARADLADCLFNDGFTQLPEYDLGEKANTLRLAVRQWLEQNWSADSRAAFKQQNFEQREYDPLFARAFGTTGWIGLSWPKHMGGLAGSAHEQLALIEELERVDAPRVGASIQSNALIMFGTPAQQAKYLPEILQGQAMHGMGYSEPQAGSDLAALQTTAVRDGEDWIINGQKIWTTTWWGKYMFLAARTDTQAKPKHAGISMFIVPMDTQGITIHPAKTMYDGSFSNIFYDNVRIPADSLIGPINQGWRVLTEALSYERGLIGGGIVLKVARAYNQLLDYLKRDAYNRTSSSPDAEIKNMMAELAADIEAGRQLMLHCAELAQDGVTPPHYGAMSKVFSGELMERFGEAALEMLGERGLLSQHSEHAILDGRFEQMLRHSLMWVISIGTNEIQRSLIAQKGLGLPR